MAAAENLQSFRSNVTSQFGEDGILAEILRRIGEGGKSCVEFGAWDGRHFSNTWNLWHERGWSALLIEGNGERCRALRDSLAAFPKARAIEAYVSWEGENRLDALLLRAGVTGTIDVMSIDIDGDDYHVFAALQNFLPRILLIEFNPTCPPGAELIQERGGRFGCSAASLLKLAREKGYELAACTDTNLVLVRKSEFSALGILPVPLESVLPTAHLSYVMTDYDGRAYLDRLPVYANAIPPAGLRSLVVGNDGWTRFIEGAAQPVKLSAPKK